MATFVNGFRGTVQAAVGATRHLAWYVSHQAGRPGTARERAQLAGSASSRSMRARSAA